MVVHAEGKKTRMLWKTTTNTVGDVVEEESWNAVNEGSLRAVESTPGWQIFDIRFVATFLHRLMVFWTGPSSMIKNVILFGKGRQPRSCTERWHAEQQAFYF